ncbi:MAG: lipoprotein signal peptidase [Bacteroidia bacterium]|nr:lipoprotein signal peptidase [Bacteroidia bacterium]
MKKPILLVVLILIIDQLVKIWIKTNMHLGEEINVLGNKFIIHFTENNGMAFGMEFAGEYGKLLLTLFRLIAIAGIGWYLWDLTRKKAKQGYIYSIALIFAGALGNLIDSCFYGLIFNESYGEVAKIFPPEGGYGKLFHGRVVDMLYFPLIEGNFPAWFPIWGGEDFLFFRPVFNIADSSISIGVALILIFQKSFFEEPKNNNAEENLSN